MNLHERPGRDEHTEYFSRYVDLVDPGDADILTHLKAQGMMVLNFMRGLDESHGAIRYAEGKWSVNELIGHLIDMERLLVFRGLWIARAEKQEQPGVDEDIWASFSNAGSRTFAALRREQHVCRTDHIYLMRSFSEKAWSRTGLVDEHRLSLRSIPWIIAGHELHHLKVMKERYGLPVPV